jgi:phosphoglycolate phosphatase-like HAD superfamily hydrolase
MDDKPLASWRDGAVRNALLDYVARVTTPGSPDFLPPEQRIATFDNDGTLWCERPYYTQVYSALNALVLRAEADPSLRTVQPYQAAVENDLSFFLQFVAEDRVQELVHLLVEATAGETQAEFEARGEEWFASARHPLGRLFSEMTYAPMVELVELLQAAEFRVFICTAAGMDLVRLVAQRIYRIPRENVIGSNVMLAWEEREGGPVLVRTAGIVPPFNENGGKPVNIQLHVGRPPVFVAGNSDGDLEMMRFAAASGLPFLNLLVHHTDDEREYAYDAGAERVLALAASEGWTVVDMARDWERVFA